MRNKITNFATAIMFSILFLGLLNLCVVQGRKLKDLSKKNCIRLLPQEGCRGRIFDRNGSVIVDNFLSYDVLILPQEKKQMDNTLLDVSKILGTDYKDLKDTFKNNYLASFSPTLIAKNIDIKKVLLLEELKTELEGLIIQPQPQRLYSYGRLASHIIGYLSEIDHWRLRKLADYGYKTKDIVGFGGIEEKYDYYLRQEEGGMSIEVDHRGRFVRVIGFRPPKNGKDIQLTLDLRIQKIAEEVLSDRKGSVIVMDPYSGEILAMVSFPNFNPAVFIKKSSGTICNLFNDSNAPLINRAISGVYPAGSVFKLIVAMAALETGKINSSTTFVCEGKTRIGRGEFACWNTHGQQNLIAGITHSCNIFFYRSGLLLGAQLIHDYAIRSSFAKITGIELPYESSGFVPSPLWRRIHHFKKWFDGDTVNFAIGQGDLLVTPLQISRMMAIFANKGKLVRPYIVKALDGRDISLYQKKSIVLGIKASSIDYIRQGLRNVISQPDGTANILGSLGVSVAGKTGTAQVAQGQSHGWFVGFLPYKNPKFVICVFLEHAGAGYYASMLTKQIIERMIQEKLIE